MLLVMIFSCDKVEALFRTQNHISVSIVACYKLKCTPSEWIGMIKKLSFSQYIFRVRKKHVETLVAKLNIAKAEGSKIGVVCLYINN